MGWEFLARKTAMPTTVTYIKENFVKPARSMVPSMRLRYLVGILPAALIPNVDIGRKPMAELAMPVRDAVAGSSTKLARRERFACYGVPSSLSRAQAFQGRYLAQIGQDL